MKFLGAPYPIGNHPLGYFHTQTSLDQVKSDLLILLLTNPGERVMLPEFGTPLKSLIFEPNDVMLEEKARQMVVDSINAWEPRIVVSNITVSSTIDPSILSSNDDRQNEEHILSIVIDIFDPENIKEVQQLKLLVPLGGANG